MALLLAAPGVCGQEQVLPQTGSLYGWFGFQVDLDENRLAVSAPRETTELAEAGRVWVYDWDGKKWFVRSIVESPTPEAMQRFGWGMALSGDHLAVSSGQPLQRDLWVKNLSAVEEDSWHLVKRSGYQPLTDDKFGTAISIAGKWMAVGTPGDDAKGYDAGCVVMFKKKRKGKGWKQVAVLRAPDTNYGDQFGFALDMDGKRLVVGARYDDTATTNAGAAYVFKRTGREWNFEARLEATLPEPEARLGTAVAIQGRDIAVGAPGQDTFQDNAGMVFTYRRKGSTWEPRAPLAAFDPMPDDQFGCSLDMSSNLVVVGASGHNGNTGAGYVFRRQGGQEWIAQRGLGPVDYHGWYNFGLSVATHGDQVVIGAVGDDTVTSNAGCAWAYSGNLLDPLEVNAYCYCTNLSPCENVDPEAGCSNSSGQGARLEAGGTVSLSSDDLVLFGSGFPEEAVTQLHFGDAGQFTPYGDGYMCVGGVQNGVFTFPAQVADQGGLVTYGSGLLDQVASLHGPLAVVGVGETWSFQITFSDPDGPCGLGINSSNALAVTYAP